MNKRIEADHLRIGAFLGGTGLSIIGNVMAMVALPWFVLQTTGSPTQTGLTGMATALPAFASGIFGGPLIDRLGGRRMSVIADLISGVAIAAIPALYLTVGLEFWQLFALVLLGALLDIPGFTARRMLLPGFAERASVRPEAITSAFEMLQSASGIIGPAIAGLLIAPMGAVNLLWLTAGGFALSALTVYGVAPEIPPDPDDAEQGTALSYRARIAQGLSFIGNNRLLLALAIVFGVSNFLTAGFYAVGLPVTMFERFGTAATFGVLISVTSIGTLVGGSLYGAFGHRFRPHRRTIILVGFMTQPFFIIPFIWDSPYPLLLVSCFLSGLAIGPVNPLSVTVRFEHIPTRLQGRVFATFSAISGVVSPMGMLLAGYLFDAVSLSWAVAVVVILAAALALWLPGVRALEQMNRPAEETEGERHPAT